MNFQFRWIKISFRTVSVFAGPLTSASEDDLNLPHAFGKGQPGDGPAEGNAPPLLLVGTVHRDPQGKPALLELLEKERPAFIAVEISPYARTFRLEKGACCRAILRKNLAKIHGEEGLPWRKILSHGAIQGIYLLLKMPYEWRAAEQYARKNGAVVEESDLSRYSEEKLSRIAELVSEENLLALLGSPSPGVAGEAAAQYRRARALFSRPPSVSSRSGGEDEREAFMAGNIRRMVARAGGKKVIHVGGWEHLVELSGRASLFGLLQDLLPRRVLLR